MPSLLLALLACALPPIGGGRVVVLFLEGADARTVETLLEAGELPNLKRLAQSGSFARMTPTLPLDAPSVWASINTGQNPAKTGVPGFVTRRFSGSKQTPVPAFGHLKRESRKLGELPFEPEGEPTLLDSFGRYGNPLATPSFWDIAGEAGTQAIVLGTSQSFDRESPDGVRVLHGAGLPDARGAIGDWQIYSTSSEEAAPATNSGRRTPTAGTVYRIERDNEGIVETTYYGPRNFALEQHFDAQMAELEAESKGPRVSFKRARQIKHKLAALRAAKKSEPQLALGIPAPLRMSPLDKMGGGYEITLGTASQTLAPGEWSDFFHVGFELTPEYTLETIVRCKLLSVEPELELFFDVLNVDPTAPPFWQPISSPPSYAAELAQITGFETYGWPSPTMALKDGLISPETLLEDLEFNLAWREKLLLHEADRKDWRLFVAHITELDHAQHMLSYLADPRHARFDAEAAARKLTLFGEEVRLDKAVEALYRRIDRIVGRILDEVVGEGDTLLVASPSGSQPFHTQVQINNMLVETGFLVLAEGALGKPTSRFRYVDWKQTRAYSLGLGNIYLNLKGREPMGIVDPQDATSTLAELAKALLAWRDPATGEAPIRALDPLGPRHAGPFAKDEADASLGFAPGYRGSWKATSGGLSVVRGNSGFEEPGPILEPNLSLWSAGHASNELENIAGVFFSNRPVALGGKAVHSLQLAPTVLELLGVDSPAELDRAPLTFE